MSQSKPKAYSYIRFSSPEQAKGDSYRRQREAAEAYCTANGLELVSSRDYLFFDKGRSAFKGRHVDDTGELARFLSYVENGTIPPGSTLIVESLDRLSRERVKDALPRFLDLLNKGIRVYTSADGKLYTDEYNELDLIISIVHMSRAHSESHIKGQRVQKAWSQKQVLAREEKKPLGKACPYWLEYKEGRYQPIEDRVSAVRRIFDLALAGYGHRAIAKILNEEGVPVFGSTKRNLSGKWGSSSTSKILSNRALIGEYQPTSIIDGVRTNSGSPVTEFFPAVISEETFYAASAARTARKVSKATKPSKNFNVWAGILVCGLCAGPMHLVNKGKPPKGNKYLRCYNAAKGVCTARLVRLDASELVFREILAKVDSLSLIQSSAAEIRKKISVLDGKILDLNTRLSELQSQIMVLGGKLPASLVQVITTLEDDLAQYSEQRSTYVIELQREVIADKGQFFDRLDLISYSGRALANSLLKQLRMYIAVEQDFETDNDMYWIYANADSPSILSRFDYIRKSSEIIYHAFTHEGLALSKTQGDDFASIAVNKLKTKVMKAVGDLPIKFPDSIYQEFYEKLDKIALLKLNKATTIKADHEK